MARFAKEMLNFPKEICWLYAFLIYILFIFSFLCLWLLNKWAFFESHSLNDMCDLNDRINTIFLQF